VPVKKDKEDYHKNVEGKRGHWGGRRKNQGEGKGTCPIPFPWEWGVGKGRISQHMRGGSGGRYKKGQALGQGWQ